MSFAIGLTGGIACGKSTAGRIFSQNGFDVLDTDTVAHDCLDEQGPCYQEIVNHFGKGVVTVSGSIDRKILGNIVFSNEEELKTLNRILHPVIAEKWRGWRKQKRVEGRNLCILIPLLFEVEATDGWDRVIVISATEPVMLKRLYERGLTDDQAKDRLQAQMDVRDKEQRADIVISNNGSLEEFENKVKKVIEKFNLGRN